MDFSHLNKILEKSFEHVKRDIITLKDGHQRNIEKIKKAYDDFHTELKNTSDQIISGVSGKKDILELKSKVDAVTASFKELKDKALQKKDLNAKLLTLYKSIKNGQQTKKKIDSAIKKILSIEKSTERILKSSKSIEESKIEIDAIKDLIKKEVDAKISAVNNRLKAIPELRKELAKANKKIASLQEGSKMLARKVEFDESLDNITKHLEMMISEINRLDAEKVKTAEFGNLKSRTTRAEQRLNETRSLMRDSENIKEKLAKISRNLNIINEKLKLDKKELAMAEKKAEVKSKKPSNKPDSEKGEGVLFKNAIDSVIDYFTEEEKAAAEKKKTVKKPVSKKK